MSETRLLELTMKPVNLLVSRFSSRNSMVLDAIAGFRYAHPA